MFGRTTLRARCAPSLIGLALISLPIACGGPDPSLKPVSPVKGRVLLDGKPAAGALVVFHPVGDPTPNPLDPRGIVGLDGSVAISTHNANDGAPPGRYELTVHDVTSGPEDGVAPGPPNPRRIPPRYADRKSSKLEATVEPGDNTLPTINLTR